MTKQEGKESKQGATPGRMVVDTLWPDGNKFNTAWGNKTREGLAASIDELTAAPELLHALRWLVTAERQGLKNDIAGRVKYAEEVITKSEGRA